MGNTDRPMGFIPHGELLRERLYCIETVPTINVCIGDAVIASGDHILTPKKGYLQSIRDSAIPDGVAGLLGAVVSVFDENMKPTRYIAPSAAGNSTIAGYVMVADHPDQEFICQEDADGNAIDTNEGSMNVDVQSDTLCAPQSVTGLSTQELDSTTAGNAAALQVKIIRPHEDDTPGDDSDVGCRYIVQFNEHYYGDTMGGIA